ncbi:hypothetical protein GCM10007972_04770 [Iodidimonas muriae]|uniref:DnaA N-terminal domain-containing protein n=1 Tax=Iodidimonas muriae TaxID=261467 RepID=A0ABQ2L8H3_9PROT|nr:hypothetical protein GCM10007972_04770 [Iodidimonas muriae]
MHGRTTCMGAPDDTKGRTTCAPPLKNPLKEKKGAGAGAPEEQKGGPVNPADAGGPNFFDPEAIREGMRAWADEHRPDLTFDATFSAWVDHLAAHGMECQSEKQAIGLARGWFRRASGRTRRAGADSANPVKIEPSFTVHPSVTDQDRALWQATAERISQQIGPDAWRRWFSEIPFLGVAGDEAALIVDPDGFKADYIRRHFLGLVEIEMSAVMGRKIYLKLQGETANA